MKKIFLMGDSICGHYRPRLSELMKGRADIFGRQDLEAAFQDLTPFCNSRADLEVIQTFCSDPAFKPDLISLNCGLHDIKVSRTDNSHEVEPEEYRRNLIEISKFLRGKCPLIWVRTTPVDDSIHNQAGSPFFRFNADVELYNKIADEVMDKYQIPLLDLYGFTRNLGADGRTMYIDHVHYHESVRELQAAFIAGYFNAYLQEKK